MTFKSSLISGYVRQVFNNIFAVVITNRYDRGMLFARYQEFYESPYSQLKGKVLPLEHFMKIYTKKKGNDSFTYPSDWGGYNIPSNVLKSAIDKYQLYDRNDYDFLMDRIYTHCEYMCKSNKFYVIGVDNEYSSTMRHEVAHGLCKTNRDYKKKVKTLISGIPKRSYNLMKKVLLMMKYMRISQ